MLCRNFAKDHSQISAGAGELFDREGFSKIGICSQLVSFF